MKYIITTLILTMWLGSNFHSLEAQQFPIPIYQILNAGPFNPGRFPAGDLNEATFTYQQRTLQASGWSSTSQFLQYINKPIGKKENFGWGVMLTNDREHTESRLAFSPNITVQVIDNGQSALSIGFSAGILHWSSSYDQRNIYDFEDPFLQSRTNFFEVDAGLGASYSFETEAFELEVGGAANQLTGNLITKQLQGLRILPHYVTNASILYQALPGLKVGPRVFYKNTLNQGDATLIAATTDIGMLVKLVPKNFWLAGSYRINQSAITAGTGFRISKTDTAHFPEKLGSFMDVNLGFSYPLGDAMAFGPTAEIGLKWSFGRKKRKVIDNSRLAETFWKSDDWMTAHRVEKLDPNGPQDLYGTALIDQRAVYIRYSFPDISRRYVGDYPEFKRDTMLYRIGMEWEGVDALMENMPAVVIPQCLWPDTTGVMDPGNMEPLRLLSHLELSAYLRSNEVGVHFSSEIEYEGELGTNNYSYDTLFLDVVFDDLDTTLAIRIGTFMSQLELAAIKLHAMRSKLEYEFEAQMGDNYILLREGAIQDEDDYRTPIKLKKMRIISDNPQMQFFQRNQIELKFLRDRNYIKDESLFDPDRDLMPSKEEELGVEADEGEYDWDDDE